MTIAGTSLNADFPGVSVPTDFTLAFWLKPDDDASAWEYWISYGDSYYLRVDPTNEAAIFSIWDGTYYDLIEVDDITGITAWRHYVISFDGTAHQATVWISTESSFGDIDDGTSPITYADVTGARQVTSYKFNIGNKSDGTVFIDGYVAQPIVFNRKINAIEAEEIYTHGITGAD